MLLHDGRPFSTLHLTSGADVFLPDRGHGDLLRGNVIPNIERHNNPATRVVVLFSILISTKRSPVVDSFPRKA